jgi:alpha-galactosidase
MAGLLGLTFRHGELGEADEAELARQIALYKELATVLRRGAGILLTEQAVTGVPAWEAMEVVTSQGDAVLFVYANDPGVESVTVRPRALRRSATYTIVSADRGTIGSATGAELMADGVEVVKSPVSSAHILLLTRERPRLPAP